MIRLQLLPLLKQDSDFESMPHYVRIYEVLYDEIVSGRAVPGDPLPSENAMAAYWKVSRGTVRNALRRLEEDGFIARGQGRTSVITDRVRFKKNPVNLLYDNFIEDAVEKVNHVRIRCGYQRCIALVASYLDVPEGTLMVSADLGYYSGAEKIGHKFCTISETLLRSFGLSPGDSAGIRAFLTGTIYRIARRERFTYFITPSQGEPTFKHLDPHTPLLVTEGVIYGENEQPHVYFKGHRNAFRYSSFLERKAGR